MAVLLTKMSEKSRNQLTWRVFFYCGKKNPKWNCNLWKKNLVINGKNTKKIEISSFKPKVDNRFFVDLHVLYKLWTWHCSTSSDNQNFYKTSESTKNRLSNPGLIEETMDLSRTLLNKSESQKFFHFVLNLKTNVPSHNPEHYPPKEKMLRFVIEQTYFEVWAKVKNFLRLRYL